MTSAEKETSRGCLLGLLFLPVSILAETVTYFCYWSWFIQPLGTSSITFWHAMGFAWITTVVRRRGYDPVQDKWIEFWFGKLGVYRLAAKQIYHSIGFYLIALFCGWLISLGVS